MKKKHIETGIDREASGRFRVNICIEGRSRVKRFGADATLEQMRRWRDAQKVQDFYKLDGSLLQPGELDPKSLIGPQVDDYLQLRAAMPSIKDRTRIMRMWAQAFGARLIQHEDGRAELVGGRDPKTITFTEIGKQLERWRASGNQRTGGALGAVQLNNRLKALANFFTLMLADSVNPCRRLKKYDEEYEQKPLELPSIEDARKAVAATCGGNEKGGVGARLRCAVMLETGWPWSTLKLVKREHLNFEQASAIVHGRKKGGGTRAMKVPLTEQAIAALKQFDAFKLYGSFSRSSVYHSFKRGCIRAGLAPFRPYALRHRFITTLYESTADERGVALLALHTTPAQTRRYGLHAGDVRAIAARDALQAAQKAAAAPPPAPKSKPLPKRAALRIVKGKKSKRAA